MVWAVLLLVLAFLLIFVELFVPSFGTLALASLGCFAGATALAFAESTAAGFAFIGVAVVGIPGAIWLGVKVFRRSPLGRRMILAGPTQDLRGGGVSDAAALVGAVGVAHTVLRPAGIAVIEGRRRDVVTEGRMVAAGTKVEVVAVEGNRMVVRPVEGSE